MISKRKNASTVLSRRRSGLRARPGFGVIVKSVENRKSTNYLEIKFFDLLRFETLIFFLLDTRYNRSTWGPQYCHRFWSWYLFYASRHLNVVKVKQIEMESYVSYRWFVLLKKGGHGYNQEQWLISSNIHAIDGMVTSVLEQRRKVASPWGKNSNQAFCKSLKLGTLQKYIYILDAWSLNLLSSKKLFLPYLKTDKNVHEWINVFLLLLL